MLGHDSYPSYVLAQSDQDSSRQHLLAHLEDTKREFTPQQAEAMRRLDREAVSGKDAALLMRDVPVIAGVLGDVKPSASVEGGKLLERFAETMGLAYRQRKNGMAVISRSDGTAEELVAAFEDMGREDYSLSDRVEADRRIGELLGFPKTATEYFIARSRSLSSSPPQRRLPIIKPAELENTARGMLVGLMLSPDHWQDEIESYVIPIESSLREFAPETYRAYEEKARVRALSGIGAFAAKQVYGEDVAVRWV